MRRLLGFPAGLTSTVPFLSLCTIVSSTSSFFLCRGNYFVVSFAAILAAFATTSCEGKDFVPFLRIRGQQKQAIILLLLEDFLLKYINALHGSDDS